MPNEFCEHCDKWIEIPVLNGNDKFTLLNILRNEGILYAIKFVKDQNYLELKESKEFVDHICKEKGTCHKCGHIGLWKEYGICTECKSLCINLNK